MASIDKLYLGNWYQYSVLKEWALIYYPKLLMNFYYPFLSKTEWDNWQREKFETQKKVYYDGKEIPYIHTKDYEDARFDEEFEKECELPVTNTPIKVDRKLLWICPIGFVRDYLLNNCGYKTRWYHKIFWRGRRYFR